MSEKGENEGMAMLMNKLENSPDEQRTASSPMREPDSGEPGILPENTKRMANACSSIKEIRPDYYGETDPFEPWKIIRAKKMDFFQGTALKYLMRAGVKNPETRDEDIDKAITYLLEWKRNGNSHE